MSTKDPPSAPDVRAVRDALVRHYRQHRRALPWRDTRDPYAIWVSEVMLQQTRVDTVVPYYHRFLARFPTVTALADASEGEVLALWSGLGYYRRARMLHAGVRQVVAVHGGEVPGAWDGLRALPGVGDYTAGAIGSIAFGLRVPVVDGNVERVLSRLHAVPGDPRSAVGRRALWALATQYADDPHAGEVNQALMELGATVCTPVSPQCLTCPVRTQCAAAATGDAERFPEKAPRTKAREEHWCAVVARNAAGSVWLTTVDKGRWQGMLVPPMAVDTQRKGTRWLPGAIAASGTVRSLREAGAVLHVLTHARMNVRVFVAEMEKAPMRGRMVAAHELSTLAVPRITERILKAAETLQSLSRKR